MYFEYVNVLIFLLFGMAFVVLNVAVLSRIMRPTVYQEEKESTYECGEPVVGSSWVRYDMRFYTVALIFLVFDVEVAFLYPWALVFHELKVIGPFAFVEMLIFVAILVVGFAYVWVRGDLDWVKAMPRTASGARDGERRAGTYEAAATHQESE